MKTSIRIYLSIVCAVLLSACSTQTKTDTASFVLDQENEHMSVENIYEKEILIKQTTTTTLRYKEIGITRTKAEKVLDSLKDAYKDMEGVSYKMTYHPKEAVEKVEVDFTKVKKDTLAKLSLVSLPADQKGTLNKDNIENKLLGLGFKEQK